jgi:NPCBM/NEW2 domain-containing protein
LTDALTGWMTAMFTVAGLMLAIALARSGRTRRYTAIGCGVFLLAGFVFLGVGSLSGQSAAPNSPTTLAAPPPTILPTESADPTARSEPPRPAKQYLSQVRISDSNHDSQTGGWEVGAKDINGSPFGHSISMGAGCQNADGGDYWVDITIGDGWRHLSGEVGLDAQSSTQSAGTWRIVDALTGRELAAGAMRAGPPTAVNADLTGVSRLRLFMNNPNAPSQYCGFVKIRTVLVWGDVALEA